MSANEAVKYVKQRLSTYSMRAGIPYDGLKVALNVMDIASHPASALQRWRMAQEIKRSQWASFIPRDKGYRKFGPGEFPGMEAFVAAGQAIYRQQANGVLKDRGRNPFHKLCTPETLAEYPIILETALSRPVIEAVTGFFGSVPRLSYVDLWVTRPNLEEDLYNSQLYHLDKPDEGIVSLFVNVFDVVPENGPFTFFPADLSRKVRRGTGYDRHSILGDGRLTDEGVFRYCRQADEVSFAGPPGSGGFVDTSICLHAGSRCQAGERVVLVLRYMPGYRTGFSDDDLYDPRLANGDPLRRLVAPGRH